MRADSGCAHRAGGQFRDSPVVGGVRVAAVIPCYRVRDKILGVLERMGPEISAIYVVDDACPEGSGELVRQACGDPRVRVIVLESNQGVGGAVCAGYRQALADDMEVIVKIDGDGQMAPELVGHLITPIVESRADYVKGNRFFLLSGLKGMPAARLFGNAILSFLTKLSTGYWQVFDPTNGFTAVSRDALERIDLEGVSKRYFFESDILFHLALARAVVADFPMRAVYADEQSSLRPARVVGTFLRGHVRNFFRRMLYLYFLRGFSLASLEILLGTLLLGGGIVFGALEWIVSIRSGAPATAGTVMLAALPIILGLQLLLSWVHFDVQAEPWMPITRLARREQTPLSSGGSR